MISTRENLLIRPWQQRKYDHHKLKVITATSVIDNKCPPYRGHVAVKLKKLQKEQERSQEIEKDNLILLQRLNHIMNTHWVDNYLPPQPKFLSRVGVYRPVDSGIDLDDEEEESRVVEETMVQNKQQRCRKLKCIACSPMRFVETVIIPEERVPWKPQKPDVKRRRSSSVPSKRTKPLLPTIKEKPKSAGFLEKKEIAKPKVSRNINLWERPNSICLSRGALKLSVNFPSDTEVRFDKGRVGSNVCRCTRGLKAGKKTVLI